MNENTDIAEAADEQVLETPAPDEAVDTTDDQQSDDNREAAKYRHRAKAAEAERDQLAERLQVLQRAEVERLASGHMADGKDAWRDGAQLEDLLTDDGDVDPAKVEALAKGLVEQHRQLAQACSRRAASEHRHRERQNHWRRTDPFVE